MQLPDLNPMPRKNRNQHPMPFCVVPDIGWARHAGDHLHFLPGLVRGDSGVSPARHQYPYARDLDAVESASAPVEDLGEFASWLSCDHRFSGTERNDAELPP